METTKVGIREFRAGLADYIASDKPVAVTRHGQTVGIFIPTPGPSQADLLALAQASARLKAVMPLGEDEVDALVKDFKVARKATTVRQRKRR
ncbi:MAG: type II toxin-antitoxin system Phd/YefM family antitoxin [Burkholderiaceae bacterium]|nr:type II toxin-antitoxin system Phd/YefM family antitoxin [Burkholderiaceae bacterium]